MADEMKPGATGKFPQGKLREDDEGELRVAMGTVDGKIVLDFGKPLKWVAMTPEEALTFASKLQDRAAELVAQKQNKKS